RLRLDRGVRARPRPAPAPRPLPQSGDARRPEPPLRLPGDQLVDRGRAPARAPAPEGRRRSFRPGAQGARSDLAPDPGPDPLNDPGLPADGLLDRRAPRALRALRPARELDPPLLPGRAGFPGPYLGSKPARGAGPRGRGPQPSHGPPPGARFRSPPRLS